MTDEKKHGLACAALAATSLGIDQASKYALRAHPVHDWPWPGFFALTEHSNFGLIANTPVPRPMILAITFGIMLVLTRKIFMGGRKDNHRENLAFALILGGAMGNFIDRLYSGYVFDWIMVFNISIFNIADVAIAGGLAWYAWLIWSKKYTESA